MSLMQDSATNATVAADALTNLAYTQQTSMLHFQASQAHTLASNAWSALGTTASKVIYHTNLASTHNTLAIQLRTAGK